MLCCIPCPRAPVRTSDKHDECWSSTWEEARTKFRAAASACGATLEAIPYDSREGFDTVWAGHAPEGGLPELTIDVAIIGDAATASSLLLHTSGTHGVEG